MKSYSVKETALILGIKERAVQTRCKKERVRKKDNKYLITDEIIKAWTQPNATANANAKQLDLEIESLKQINDETMTKNRYKDVIINKLNIEIEELKESLKSYEIEPNERIEVFTQEQYQLFEQRLKEWQYQRVELEHQEELFKAEKKSLSELYEHYKHQFEYQKKQNEKVLEMHQKLIDVIGEQNKLSIQRNIIEAKEKEVIDKNWKPQ